jgi:L-lactate utilization protein LutC
MKSPQLQEMVRKIFSDEEIKSQFITSPESVLSRYSLTDDEKKAVRITHTRLGLATSGSVQLEAAVKSLLWWD